jgi:hypothetical protein
MQLKSKFLKIAGRYIDWHDSHRRLSMVLVGFLAMTITLSIAYWYKDTYGVNIQNRVTVLFTSVIFIIFILVINLELQRSINNDKFDWMLNIINHLSQKIDGNKNSFEEVILEEKKPYKWPWGNHNTKDLEHLAAAANRFWTLYDPSDFTTAPTNKVVADWLVTNRGVARERAGYMASILRADGLPDGPRT